MNGATGARIDRLHARMIDQRGSLIKLIVFFYMREKSERQPQASP
jgi:hypothetical protein